MNKRFVFFGTILVLLAFYELKAQTSFGLRFGVGSNTIANNTFIFEPSVPPQTSALISYDIALFANIPVSKALSFQPELHYLPKGQVYERSFNDISRGQSFNYKTTQTINFIEVPLLMKYTFRKKGFKPFLIAGGSVGYALSQKFSGNILFNDIDYRNGISKEISGETVWDNDFGNDKSKDNRTDLSVVFGIGVQKSFGKKTLILDLRYNQDFTSWKEYETLSPDKVTNRGIIFSVGIGI
jgi:hypothetical protein